MYSTNGLSGATMRTTGFQSLSDAYSVAFVRRIGQARIPTLETVLLHIQLVMGGFFGLAPLLVNQATGEYGTLATFAYPLRTITSVVAIGIAFLSGARLPRGIMVPIIAVYCLYLVATAVVSPDPAGTLRAAIDFSLILLALALLASALPAEAVVTAIFNVLAVVLVISTLLALLVPEIGQTQLNGSWIVEAQVGSWRGLFEEKNGLGGTAAVALIAMGVGWNIWRSPTPFRIAGIAAALACTIQARSANAAGGVIAMVGTDILLLGNPARARAFGTWAVTLPAVVGLALSPYLEQVFAVLGRDSTGSARTLIWSYSLNVWRQSPVFGHGFVQGTVLMLEPAMINAVGKSARHAHNGYIESLVDTGVVGLMLLSTVLIGALLSASVRPRWQGRTANTALRVFQVIIVGAMAMAAADVFTFRLIGGYGAITWSAVVAAIVMARADQQH